MNLDESKFLMNMEKNKLILSKRKKIINIKILFLVFFLKENNFIY